MCKDACPAMYIVSLFCTNKHFSTYQNVTVWLYLFRKIFCGHEKEWGRPLCTDLERSLYCSMKGLVWKQWMWPGQSGSRSPPVQAVMKCILCTCLKTFVKETISRLHFVITGHWHFLNDSDKILLPEKKVWNNACSYGWVLIIYMQTSK